MLSIYLLRHPGIVQALAGTTQQEAVRIGRFLSMGVHNAVELISGTEKSAVDYATLVASSVGSQVRHDVRLRDLSLHRLEQEVHRARVRDWFDAIVIPRRREDLTLIVVAHGVTVNHVLACFRGAAERSPNEYVFKLGTGHFHRIRSLALKEEPSLWEIEFIDAPT